MDHDYKLHLLKDYTNRVTSYWVCQNCEYRYDLRLGENIETPPSLIQGQLTCDEEIAKRIMDS